MEDDLPTEYDLIVIGTGLSESIVAAAASRIGKTVLHLDCNEYYGGFWSSFNFESLRKYAEDCTNRASGETLAAKDNFVPLHKATFIENVSEDWFKFEEYGNINGWDKDSIMKEFRRFNVDLAPKLLYARGAMVELLISSNICRYAEFRAVDRVATIWNNRIMTVPCSRSDVFTSRDVNVVEKRLLMKFLQSCASYESEGGDHKAEDIEGKTFLEYLKSHKLTPNLIHYLLYTIAMGTDTTSCRQGLEGVKKFLLSLGRYGNSPFLFPMYGCGEIPQCFCRLCAVFGGIYCLNKKVNGINLTQEAEGGGLRFQSLSCDQQKLEAKNLVIGQGYVGEEVFIKGDPLKEAHGGAHCGKLARAIFLTNVPLGGASQNTGGGGAALLKLPPVEGHEDGATIIQLAHFSGTCPKDIYLIHITAKSLSDDPRADLEPYVMQILRRNAPGPQSMPAEEDEIVENGEENDISTIIYELYFNIPSCVACQTDCSTASLPKGIYLACGPFAELDFDESIARAKAIFKDIYPEEEFLPRAPDPEEIIIGEETDEAQEITVGEEEGHQQAEKVESGRECQEGDAASIISQTTEGPVLTAAISDAQEAKEDLVENAEECIEQK
ncbi:rab proteins geranylgeranyltransferase component A [Topomyia yanbarensis]|uniref:rab proteins geranylgeranyltransferase component A n=1 Tax=Topomyia yanbarensis TaxID=2498891 RepID=UPI00273C4F4D|nr:rab proteins geranylgeranyltransferase component A [Topomyia yanbarensis]